MCKNFPRSPLLSDELSSSSDFPVVTDVAISGCCCIGNASLKSKKARKSTVGGRCQSIFPGAVEVSRRGSEEIGLHHGIE